MKIEGRNAVSEALKSGQTIDNLLVEKNTNHEIIAKARKAKIKIQFVDKKTLDKISTTGKHQGFIAEVTDFVYSSVEDILSAGTEGKRFIVILDGIEDPHNLGSILRVCECAGVDGVIIGKNRSCTVNDTVVRVSAGASAHVKVAKVTNLNTTIEELKAKNIWVYCADMDGVSVYDVDMTGNVALVIGGEGSGVAQLVKTNCDGVVALAINGKVNSLNASVACGITVYEVVRQRLMKK